MALATVDDLMPTNEGTTSVAVRYGQDSQLAIFHVPKRGYFATQQMCPHKRAFVLEHGIVGDDADGNLYVSCPLHKRNFRLDDGSCTNDDEYKILAFEVKEAPNRDILLRLPPPDDLDALIGSSKWMVRKATAEALGKNEATRLEIVGPSGAADEDKAAASTDCGANESHSGGAGGVGGCGGGKLEW